MRVSISWAKGAKLDGQVWHKFARSLIAVAIRVLSRALRSPRETFAHFASAFFTLWPGPDCFSGSLGSLGGFFIPIAFAKATASDISQASRQGCGAPMAIGKDARPESRPFVS